MGFGAAQVSKGEKEMLDQVAPWSHRPGPEPSRSARGAHRQLSASAVGSTHRIVRRPEEGRLPGDQGDAMVHPDGRLGLDLRSAVERRCLT